MTELHDCQYEVHLQFKKKLTVPQTTGSHDFKEKNIV